MATGSVTCRDTADSDWDSRCGFSSESEQKLRQPAVYPYADAMLQHLHVCISARNQSRRWPCWPWPWPATASSLIVAVLMLVGNAAMVQADTPRVSPGIQEPAPEPAQPRLPPLDMREDKRRIIRGCAVAVDCLAPDLTGLRAFELETFGPPVGRRGHDWPANPWVDDDPYGHRVKPQTPTSTRWQRSPRHRTDASPVELRPDLPWLAELELPDLPFRWDERIIRYLEFYKDDPRGRNIMGGWLRAQGKYRDMMQSTLRRAGLPEDLIYVAMIESSYNPTTISRVGAAGLWQFMEAAGRIYGLHIDRWIDERRDPERATAAAVQYFIDLYQRFGDWHLVLAAYNAGYGAVLRSVARYNTNDYWQLIRYENGLPWGTSLYVAKALATAIVGRNRQRFGFDSVEPAKPVVWDSVSVPKSLSIAVIARAAGVSVETIERLNPQLRRGRTPPSRQDYVVRVPQGSAQVFAARFPQLRGDWDRYDAYVVAYGERFEDVATIHGLSRRKLARLNGVEHESEIRGGMLLVVPKVSAEEKARNRAVAQADLYQAGDPPGEADEPLLVAVPDLSTKIPGTKRVFYRVTYGDTLADLAAAFAVPPSVLASWNGLERGAKLQPRMVLQVFVPESFSGVAAHGSARIVLLDEQRLHLVSRGSAEHLDEVEGRLGRERIVYVAQERESFAEIAEKFGLSSRDLARINRRSHSTVLEPGEEIMIYDVVDKERSSRAAEQAKAKAKATRKRRSSKRERRN